MSILVIFKMTDDYIIAINLICNTIQYYRLFIIARLLNSTY